MVYLLQHPLIRFAPRPIAIGKLLKGPAKSRNPRNPIFGSD